MRSGAQRMHQGVLGLGLADRWAVPAGYACYAEAVIGPSVSLFEDPWQEIGRLAAELTRFLRAAADKALHDAGHSSAAKRARARRGRVFLPGRPVDNCAYTMRPKIAMRSFFFSPLGDRHCIRRLRWRAQNKF